MYIFEQFATKVNRHHHATTTLTHIFAGSGIMTCELKHTQAYTYSCTKLLQKYLHLFII